MITETGENLNILINACTAEDWMAFATWYSAFKNLPDAKIAIICNRNQLVEFQYFQWAKRLNIPLFYQVNESDFVSKMRGIHLVLDKGIFLTNVLCIEPGTVFTDVLSNEVLETLNKTDFRLLIDDSVFYSMGSTKDQIMDIWSNHELTDTFDETVSRQKICYDAREENINCLCSFRKGCGKWIHTMKGCPFSSAGGMIAETMTVNELRIIELWRKMVPLYSAVL